MTENENSKSNITEDPYQILVKNSIVDYIFFNATLNDYASRIILTQKKEKEKRNSYTHSYIMKKSWRNSFVSKRRCNEVKKAECTILQKLLNSLTSSGMTPLKLNLKHGTVLTKCIPSASIMQWNKSEDY